LQELVYSEFFSQGDLEKAMGNKPVESMDRERAYIPTLQTEFLDGIALPVYRYCTSAVRSITCLLWGFF
jgi:cGMP-dependent 3',5'-cyclic phosphodiesterase